MQGPRHPALLVHDGAAGEPGRREPGAPGAERAADGAAADDGALIDWRLVAGWARFVLTAPRRHPALAGGLFAATVALGVAVVLALPRTYYTECRILALRNLVMPALGNPNRAIPLDADAPTRAAPETILRRDNLLALVEQTDLLQHWERTRAPLARAKDAVVSAFTEPLDEDEKRDALVYVLERRLRVVTGEGTIQIEVDWPDAQMAYQLVTLAQQNFLESRHAIEVSTIAEAISILEGHAGAARGRVENAMAELREQLRKEREGSRQPPPVVRPAPREPPASPELANLKVMLVAKRRALRDLESFRQRRLGELQAQLTEQKVTYTPQHPVVVATRDSLDALQKDSPQLASLRREERDLLRQYQSLGGTEADVEGGGGAGAAAGGPAQFPAFVREVRRDQDESETAQYWRTQLDYALQKYESLVSRIEAARIEMDTARAAFKYRYTVVRPAEVSRRPSRPRIPRLVAAVVLAGALLAFAGTTLLDVRRRRLLQAWQVEGQLRVPLLAELEKL